MTRIQSIIPPDAAAMQAAKMHWDSIAKPLGSFGMFEDMIVKIAGIQRTVSPDITHRTAVVLCADHGVTAQGVTQCGSEVTAVCAAAIAEGRSNINSLAAVYGAKVIAVDMGMVQEIDCPALLKRRISAGTADLSTAPAMTRTQAEQCIRTGIDLACMAKAQGAQILLTGEMGIGNTTAASAIAAVLLGKDPAEVTGRGAGLSDAGLQRKTEVIRRSLALHRPDPSDPVGLLSAVGGFEIAGMTGLFLGGAVCHLPVVIDGVISAAAAAIACRIEPLTAQYLLPSHSSDEPAGEGLLRLIGLQAPLHAGLRLGEGTGGMLLLPLLDGALALYRTAHTFAEENIAQYQPGGGEPTLAGASPCAASGAKAE